MKHAAHHLPARRHHGAATLVVVMALFLVMALLAAYANRSLMFEQRIAGSYYRSSMAQEMAEGGVDWTVAMLNGTGINANCQAVNTGGTRFVDKYVTVSAADRATKTKVTSETRSPLIDADCNITATGLVCRCADPNTARTAQERSTTLLFPSVAVALATGMSTDTAYGNFQVTSLGCTDNSVDNCFSAGAATMSQRSTAASMLWSQVGFIAAVPSSPTAPLTVKGRLLTSGAGGLGLHNTDPLSAGTLVVSGGDAPALNEDRMDSVPGTPPVQARIFRDPYLSKLVNNTEDNTRFFRGFMGMAPERYKSHPAAQVVSCPVGGGCETALEAAVSAGKRILLVKSPMAINGSSKIIGSLAAPVLIVVYGPVQISGSMQLNGMLVVQGNLDWDNTGGGTSMVTGMVVVQGDMTTIGRMDIVYQQSIANDLRNRLGSYARVPGGTVDAAI